MQQLFTVAEFALILYGYVCAGKSNGTGLKSKGRLAEWDDPNWPVDVDQGEGDPLFPSGTPPNQMPVPKPPFYRYVPIATHWRTPVVAKERLMPVRGNLPLPTDIQRILFPPRHYPQPLNPFRPRRPPPAVSAWCSNSKMHVRVQKNLYSRQSRHLTLGVGCKSNLESKYYYYFNYGLHECGSNRSVINGQLTYSNILHHTPPKTKGPVHRSLPFNLSIQCRYNRFHQVYKVGYRALLPRNYHFRNLKNKHSFVLSTANADWTRLSSRNAYDLGQPMYFQATAYFVSEEQRLFIHWCYATLSPNHFSEPRFKVIDNFGCMIDSKLENCHSKFVPSKSKDVVRFVIDAFQFDKKRLQKSMLYLHCNMAVAGTEATVGNKACTYNKLNKRWEELFGNHEVCRCCDGRCSGRSVKGTNMVRSAPVHFSQQKDTFEEVVEEVGPSEVIEKAVKPGEEGAEWDSLPLEMEDGWWGEDGDLRSDEPISVASEGSWSTPAEVVMGVRGVPGSPAPGEAG